ncbi:MAG: helix-turn-helix transcriptional regulator [Wenzhouxiangellaceae bacterium]
MPIRIRIDVMMAERRIKAKDLAAKLGITAPNLSVLKQGRDVRAIRLSTLEGLCRHLQCQPGDLLEYIPDEAPDQENT